jgi:2-polyprenyl-3-methyl-5-hydroxy-6-metoxy-1,4-benzoquinol methylase
VNPYIELPKVPMLHGRKEFVLSKCKGKRVLHLGCVDSGLYRERFFLKELMHQKLAEISSELYGIDTDLDGIIFLRNQGFDNLIVGDVCNADKIPELQGIHFDVIVASEIIEHLMNPGLFLNAVKNVMIQNYTELIVTVPNAYRVSTLFQLLRGVEFVHPDHNYWFSYTTIKNLLKKAQLEINETYVYSFQVVRILPKQKRQVSRKKDTNGRSNAGNLASHPNTMIRILHYSKSLLRKLFIHILYKRTPFWGDGLIMVCKKP